MNFVEWQHKILPFLFLIYVSETKMNYNNNNNNQTLMQCVVNHLR